MTIAVGVQAVESMRRLGRTLLWSARRLAGQPPRSHLEALRRLEHLKALESDPGNVLLPFGWLQYVDAASLHELYEEIFLQKVYDFHSEVDNPVVLDCGSNIGLSVIRFKEMYPKSKVIAFEADPKICNALKTNVVSLGLTAVDVVGAAVWHQPGEVRFQSLRGGAGHVDPRGTLQVESVSLKDFAAKGVDLLKLDIEGAEWEVLWDLCRDGSIRRVTNLVCELHGWADDGGKLARILNSLCEQGFRCAIPIASPSPDVPLPGPFHTPFPRVYSGKFQAYLYAWNSGQSISSH